MKRLLVITLTLLVASIAGAADRDYYVKDCSGSNATSCHFVKVEKTDAVLAILQHKSEVVQCSQMRLTKKLTLKAVSRNDD